MTAAVQPSLFDAGARNTDPDTSHIASQRDRATDRQRALLLHARHPDGLTDFELAALMDRQQTSAGKRRHEWTVKGGADRDYVVDSGRRRPAPSGSPAIVWQITPAGLAVARHEHDIVGTRCRLHRCPSWECGAASNHADALQQVAQRLAASEDAS